MRVFSHKVTLDAGKAANGFYCFFHPDKDVQVVEGNTVVSMSTPKAWKQLMCCFEFVVAAGANYRRGVRIEALIMGQHWTESVALPLKPSILGEKLSWTGILPIDWGFGYLIYPGSLENGDVATMTVLIADKGELS